MQLWLFGDLIRASPDVARSRQLGNRRSNHRACSAVFICVRRREMGRRVECGLDGGTMTSHSGVMILRQRSVKPVLGTQMA